MQDPVHPMQSLQAVKMRTLSYVRSFLSRPLQTILLLAFIQGLFCFIVIPAWWHYDEPGHFEYVWLAAHSPHWPVAGQYDQAMRKEMAASMVQVGWYRIRNIKVDIDSSEPIPIGVLQVGDQPGYYFLASLPLRLMPNADITLQYNAVRLISFGLFLLIIVAVWYASGALLGEASPLRWMTTVFVALLPAFADTMISVNNDVAAVLAVSVFLWSSLLLIQKGYSPGRIIFLVVSLIGCYVSKSTAWFTIALAPLVLLLALLRGRFVAWLWGVVIVGMVAAGALMLKWGSPQGWYQGAAGNYPRRIQATSAPVGQYAFEFVDAGAGNANQIVQLLPPDQVKRLRGKTASLGAWLWADQATQAGPLFVRFMRQSGDLVDSPRLAASVTPEPAFHKLQFSVPDDATGAMIYVQQGGHANLQNNVFFDGLLLVPGEFGEDPPQYASASGTQGTWSGQEFENLVRNGSAEDGSAQVRKWVNDKTAGPLTKSGINLPLVITMTQDWKGTSWYYRSAAGTLFRTFWASLAGDKAFLASSYVSGFLALITLLALVGAAIRLWVHRKHLRWDMVGFLGILLLIPWLFAIAKGSSDLLGTDPLAPWARYAYPAILPTALMLCAGWLEWMELLQGRIRLPEAVKKAIFLGVIGGISIFTIMNAMQVFHPEWWYGWGSLALLFLFQYMVFHVAVRWRAQPSS